MDAKRRKAFAVAALGKESYASKSAIEKLLARIRSHGLPAASSRATQYRARKEICGIETDYGRLVQDMTLTSEKGDDLKVPIQAPLPWLQ